MGVPRMNPTIGGQFSVASTGIVPGCFDIVLGALSELLHNASLPCHYNARAIIADYPGKSSHQ